MLRTDDRLAETDCAKLAEDGPGEIEERVDDSAPEKLLTEAALKTDERLNEIASEDVTMFSELVAVCEGDTTCGLENAVKLDIASDEDVSEALLRYDNRLDDKACEELSACDGAMEDVVNALESSEMLVDIPNSSSYNIRL